MPNTRANGYIKFHRKWGVSCSFITSCVTTSADVTYEMMRTICFPSAENKLKSQPFRAAARSLHETVIYHRLKIRLKRTFMRGMTPFSTRFINCETGERYRCGGFYYAARSLANSNKTRQLDFHKKVQPRQWRQSQGIRLAKNAGKKVAE